MTLAATARGDDAPANKQPDGPKAKGEKAGKAKLNAALTADQEQEALTFARSQHPELADLLVKLQEKNPKEFEKAMQELHRAQQRLLRLAEQSPQRYPLELNLWKVDSRIRLMMGQMILEQEGQEAELKALITDRRNLKIELLKFDRSQAAEKVANLDRQLEQLQRDAESDTEKELAKVRQMAKKPGKATKKKQLKLEAKEAAAADPKPAKKPKGKEPPATPAKDTPATTEGAKPEIPATEKPKSDK
jgi:hypothetical protein